MRSVCRALCVVVLAWLPAVVWALGLQPPIIASSLGEPLKVILPVSGVRGDMPRASLASERDFDRFGLNRSDASGVDVRVQTLTGQVALVLSTEHRVYEPIVNVVVEVRHGSQRLIREVPVFLDVPGAGSSDSLSARSVNTETPARGEAEARLAAAARGVGADRARVPRLPGYDGAVLRYGPVAPGETLSGLADRMLAGRDDRSVSELSALLQGLNPSAFVAGRPWLKVGAVLRYPAQYGPVEARVPAAVFARPNVRTAVDADLPMLRLVGGQAVDWETVNAQGPQPRSVLDRVDAGLEAGLRQGQAMGQAMGQAIGKTASELVETARSWTAPAVQQLPAERERSVTLLRSGAVETYTSGRWMGLGVPQLVLLGLALAAAYWLAYAYRRRMDGGLAVLAQRSQRTRPAVLREADGDIPRPPRHTTPAPMPEEPPGRTADAPVPAPQAAAPPHSSDDTALGGQLRREVRRLMDTGPEPAVMEQLLVAETQLEFGSAEAAQEIVDSLRNAGALR